jgi:hypothetical protein
MGRPPRQFPKCGKEGCDKNARHGTGFCVGHGGGNRCGMKDCDKSALARTGLCAGHGGGNRCGMKDCDKVALGRTRFCAGHGGGNRCGEKDCDKVAQGRTRFCKRHGGGNRCGMKDCDKSALGRTRFCIGHGGGNRCGMKDCDKSAQGRTGFCIGHRGGKCNMRMGRKNFKASTAAAGSHSVRVSDARATIQANLTAELVVRRQPHIQIVWGTGAGKNSSVPPNIADFNPQQLGAYVEILETESYKLSVGLHAKRSAGKRLDTKHFYLVFCDLDSHVTNGMCPTGAKSVRHLCQKTNCNYTAKGGVVGVKPHGERHFALRYSTPARPCALCPYLEPCSFHSPFIRKLSLAALRMLDWPIIDRVWVKPDRSRVPESEVFRWLRARFLHPRRPDQSAQRCSFVRGIHSR